MATPVSLNAILKVVQEEGIDADQALGRESTLMRSIKHVKDFHGEKIAWSVPYAGLAGRSHDAATAEANDQNARYLRFEVGTVNDYIKRTLDGELCRKAMKAGVNEEFIDYVKGEMNLAIRAIAQNVSRGAYKSHTGSRGVRGSVTNAVLTLATTSDAFFFSVGDEIQASATDGGTLRDSGDFVTLIAVDYSAGTLTADANWSNIASMADGDFLYVQGDENLAYHGLGSYNPATAPTSGDAVFGGDRSVNPDGLAGIRLTTTGQSVETTLIRAMSQCQMRPGGAFGNARIYCNNVDFASLQIAKEGARVIDAPSQYEMGIQGFKVGDATVVPDPYCPEGVYHIVADGVFEFHSNNGIDIDDVDGNTMRKGSNDTYSLMALVDGDFVARNPAGLARGAWPAA